MPKEVSSTNRITSNVFNEKRITFSDSDKIDSSKSSSRSSKSIFKTKSEISELSMMCEEELDDENGEFYF